MSAWWGLMNENPIAVKKFFDQNKNSEKGDIHDKSEINADESSN